MRAGSKIFVALMILFCVPVAMIFLRSIQGIKSRHIK